MTVGTVRRVIVPCVPDSDIGPNGRLHWAVKARKVKQLREFVGWHARENAPDEPMTGAVVLRVSVGWPKGRKRHDDDNMVALLKAVQDGLTDAGWWKDDANVSIERPVDQQLWGEWSRHGGGLYDRGVMTIDVMAGE